mmetsp:Transcript_31345/g.91432  ORF Transcript_31345/g.91432 Transcript_31345/m.91432 type:complete len:326 (-) Transcript_31345:356-1333(-)
MSSKRSKKVHFGPCSPKSSRASWRALASGSATAVTTATVSPRRAMLRMCSLPIAPVPTTPMRIGPSSPPPPPEFRDEVGDAMSGGPRKEAKTLRGGTKVSRACMAIVLSTSRTSPFFHLNTTRWRSMKSATARMASASRGEPSPRTTAFSPMFRESFQPVKAATTELKKTRFPVRWSMRSAGNEAVVVRQSPLGNHSHDVPCRLMASSASSRVLTAYVSFHERPCADDGSVTSGMTRIYRTPRADIFLANSGKRVSKKAATSVDGMIGVAPPCEDSTSQWNKMYAGGFGACASSWWKGIGWSGGDSLEVKTRPGTSSVRGAAPPM